MKSSYEHIRQQYGVPAKRGARVTYTVRGRKYFGKIVGVSGKYIRVKFDGETYIELLHPTWNITYSEEVENGKAVRG